MFGRANPEVLVVGAGPVGLFAALALAKQGIQVAIVDREWRPGAHSYALALHPHSLSLLQELGIQESVLERAQCPDDRTLRRQAASVQAAGPGRGPARGRDAAGRVGTGP